MPAYDYASIARVADPNVVKRIVEIGRQRNLSDDHIAAALATGIVESNLRNLSYGDRDSQGVFQQRPSQGWGSVSQVRNVDYAANKFYDTLARTPRKGTLGSWAQAVQRSAHPERYDQALGAARQFLSAFGGGGGGGQPRPIADRPGVAQAIRSTARSGTPEGIRAAAAVGFDARQRLTELMTAMSKQQRERAQAQGQPAPQQVTPSSTAEGLAQSLQPPVEEFGQVEQALAPPDGAGFEEVAEEVSGLDLEVEDLDDDVAISVGGILAAGARNAAEAEEIKEQAARAEAEAAAQAQQRQATSPQPSGPASPTAGDRWRWGPPSSAPFAAAGLKSNALRAAQTARQLGFAGTIGGVGPRARRSDHPDGRALDFMVDPRTQVGLGDGIADYFITNREFHGVKYVIWRQRIASASSGWRWVNMVDRGSPTANHMDHPHVSFH